MIRQSLAVSLTLCLVACSKDSPTAPGGTAPTRILSVTGNLAFGGVEVGAVKELSFSIVNGGNAPLTVTGITVPDRYRPDWTSGQIPAGGSQNVTLRFEPWAPMAYDGTLTISADQTSGTPTLGISGTGTRPPGRGIFGIMTDAAGDPAPPGDTVLPDVVGAAIDVNAGTLTATVSYVPGTLSTDVQCAILLDTDENVATGNDFRGDADAGLLGSDFLILFVNPQNSGRGTLGRWDGQTYRTVGIATVTFAGSEARIAFPMSLIDNDDGRLAFKIHTGKWIGQNTGTGYRDRMTDLGAAPGITR